MNYLRKLVICFLCILCLTNNRTLLADSLENYSVVDYSSEKKEVLYSSYDFYQAQYFYYSNVNMYDNLCLLEDEKVLYMEYGTLFLNSQENSLFYNDFYTNELKSISNVNEYDILYIQENLNQVKFLCCGEIGLVDKAAVTYCPFGSRDISYYENVNGELVHHISSVVDGYYKYNLKIDKAPQYLNESVRYYSFDSKYFYDDFIKMSDDAYLDIHDNSINANEPYFNYYAYLPSRSYTNYSYDEFDNLFKNSLGINGRLNSYIDFDKDGANDVLNKSELYGNINSFLSYEKVFGVNALMSLAWSCEESAFGKSKNAYTKSNVFKHAAYDRYEQEIGKSNSINSSIYSHMCYYVSKNYCNIFSSKYTGSHIGSYISGISSSYSSDPLFSEKVVSKAYLLDSINGFKDLNNYKIGITNSNITLYYSKDLTTSYSIVSGLNDYSLIILEELDNCFKVQCDYAMNNVGEYNPEQCVLYVKKSSIDYLIGGEIKDIDYYSYKINFNDVEENNEVNLYSPNEFNVEKDFVYKDFLMQDIVGYENIEGVYKPIVKNIKEVTVNNYSYPLANSDGPLIDKMKFNVVYVDETHKEIPVTSDDVQSATDVSMTLNYKGVTTKIDVNPIDSNNTIEKFAMDNQYNYGKFNFNDVSEFDTKYSDAQTDTITTFIRDNRYDFSVEGINPSFTYYYSPTLPSLINTFYFDVKHISNNTRLSNILSKYGLHYLDSINVSVTRCFYNIDLVNPVLMQLKLDSPEENSVYSIYHIDLNGDYRKVPTQFSDNYIRFLANEDGNYYLYSLPTSSVYSSDDHDLRINIDNNGLDYYDIAQEGIQLIAYIILGFVLHVIYLFNRRDRQAWKGYKKLLQKVEFVQGEKQNS